MGPTSVIAEAEEGSDEISNRRGFRAENQLPEDKSVYITLRARIQLLPLTLM